MHEFSVYLIKPLSLRIVKVGHIYGRVYKVLMKGMGQYDDGPTHRQGYAPDSAMVYLTMARTKLRQKLFLV